MGWRDKGSWGEYRPRPKAAKLPAEDLERLHAKADKFVEESVILRDLLQSVQLARGRLYFWNEPEDLMARITPLGPKSMLLEAPRRDSWTEVKRGAMHVVLRALQSDKKGTFHGLGVLLEENHDEPPAQVILHRELGIPVRVVAEPRYWYAMHRTPRVAEISEATDRALVHFSSRGLSGSFHGTCLYARRDGEWDCYGVRPNKSDSIAMAEAWLEKRDWEGW